MPIRSQAVEAMLAAFPDAGDPVAGGPVGVAAEVLGRQTLDRLDKKAAEPLSGDWLATADALYLVLDGVEKPVRWRRKDIASVERTGGLLTAKIDVRLRGGRTHRLNVGRAAVSAIEELAQR